MNAAIFLDVFGRKLLEGPFSPFLLALQGLCSPIWVLKRSEITSV